MILPTSESRLQRLAALPSKIVDSLFLAAEKQRDSPPDGLSPRNVLSFAKAPKILYLLIRQVDYRSHSVIIP